MDAVVKAQNLVVSYGKHVALRLDDFRIGAEAGVVGLFGSNGAGKSTLLRTIVGDIARIQGRIVAPHRVAVSYLPDEPFCIRGCEYRNALICFVADTMISELVLLKSFLRGLLSRH